MCVLAPWSLWYCRHSYVRRNAVLAIHALCKLPKGDLLVPDADEHIERFLSQEQDVSAKRNALVMLTHHSQVGCSRALVCVLFAMNEPNVGSPQTGGMILHVTSRL